MRGRKWTLGVVLSVGAAVWACDAGEMMEDAGAVLVDAGEMLRDGGADAGSDASAQMDAGDDGRSDAGEVPSGPRVVELACDVERVETLTTLPPLEGGHMRFTHRYAELRDAELLASNVAAVTAVGCGYSSAFRDQCANSSVSRCDGDDEPSPLTCRALAEVEIEDGLVRVRCGRLTESRNEVEAEWSASHTGSWSVETVRLVITPT